MRDRREDLGRIAVLLEQLLDHPLFTEDAMSLRDLPDWLKAHSIDSQEDSIEKLGENIDGVEYALERILEIAQGYTTGEEDGT